MAELRTLSTNTSAWLSQSEVSRVSRDQTAACDWSARGHLARVQRLAEAGLLPGGEGHAVVDEVEGGHGCDWRLRVTECRVKFGQFMTCHHSGHQL